MRGDRDASVSEYTVSRRARPVKRAAAAGPEDENRYTYPFLNPWAMLRISPMG